MQRTLNVLLTMAAKLPWYKESDPSKIFVLVRKDWDFWRHNGTILMFPTAESANRWLTLREHGLPTGIPNGAVAMSLYRYVTTCPKFDEVYSGENVDG